MLSEAKQLDMLDRSETTLAPLSLRVARGSRNDPIDTVVAASWRGREYRFVVECKSRSTPKLLRDAINSARRCAKPPSTYPMVLVPYLSHKQLLELEGEEVSGLDANGNGVVVIPGETLVFRSGQPNNYPDSAPIKNIYRGDTSLVPRVMLRVLRYEKVTDIRDEILARSTISEQRGMKPLALSTVSKALRRLEDDLIVSRKRGRIEVVQPRKLLEQLVANYQPPKVRLRGTFKTELPLSEFRRQLVQVANDFDVCLAATGLSSVGCWAAMAREPRLSVYCTRMDELFNPLPDQPQLIDSRKEEERFWNVELIETRSAIAYFDLHQSEDGLPWASPLQTYLELMKGDKRDQETAEQVESWIVDQNTEYKYVDFEE